MEVPSEVIEELSRALGVGDEVVGGFIDWLLGSYLTKHRSVGLLRLVDDVLRSGDARVARFRRALGVVSSIDVRININDPLFARLLTSVRGVVRALAKTGVIEYIEDLGVVNLAEYS
jgi:hypothetical protein